MTAYGKEQQDGAAAGVSAGTRVGQLSRKTVLIVDDEALVQQVTQKILERLGFRVLTAEDAPEALAVVEDPSQDLDLVLLDMQLPGMSGAELLPLLLDRRPELRVILCSGGDHDERTRRALAEGAVGFVRKPYRIQVLQEAVEAALEGRRA